MKVALITAGSGGIGKATVDLFLQNGYHVGVTGRSLEKLQSVFSSYSSSHLHLIENKDVNDTISAQYVIEETIQRFGQLDVLVNNLGGATLNQRVEDGDYVGFHDTFALNVDSVFCMTTHAIPYLTETRGSIVNMSSVLGSRPVEGLGAYSASKAAVEMLFKVQVESVQVANRAGKTKRSGRFTGRRNNTRRAFVCLKSGQEINFTEEAK